MKNVSNLGLAMCLFVCPFLFAQESEPETDDFKPVFITMTTTHWNGDPETDFSDWLETEKEYFEKVTSKNDLIIGSGFYTHYFTPDNSELVMVNVYQNWEDIEKAEEMNQQLIEEAWPDEAARKKFFDKQTSYYGKEHSDEIYQTMRYRKPLTERSEKPLIYYVRKSDLAMDGQGKPENFKEFDEKVTQKNSKLKAYYSHRHIWGSNGRELQEVFVFDKLGDIEDFFAEEENLISSAWPDEKEREQFMGDLNKLFSGKHGDYIYRSVPELQK
ncbi:MAG: hypothetical protein ABGW91_15300 [Christiangramia sp.]|nr:hypothetical protein [Christiangramia sp.]